MTINITISHIFYPKAWKSLIFRLFLKHSILVPKKWWEKYRFTSEGNGRKNAQNDKTIIKADLHQSTESRASVR